MIRLAHRLAGTAALLAAIAAHGQEPERDAGASPSAPAGSSDAPATASDPGFTPSETIPADTAVAFPVDI